MVFMALYNVDKFRDFVFRSSFLKRFDVPPERIEKIKRNDSELMKFSFDWIKFGIFGQKTLFVNREEVERQKLCEKKSQEPGAHQDPGEPHE
jgi:hypothetical protein